MSVDSPLICPGYFYCNTENTYSAIACCDDVETRDGYEPYACDFMTSCYDLPAAALATDWETTFDASLGGDKLLATYW